MGYYFTWRPIRSSERRLLAVANKLAPYQNKSVGNDVVAKDYHGKVMVMVRRFDDGGKEFTYVGGYPLKSTAESAAARLQRSGFQTRVRYYKWEGVPGGGWTLWKRK